MLGRSQVSRLGLNLKSAFPFRDGTVAVLSRPLHGYWDSSEITSDSLDACPSGVASRTCAAASAYSSVEAIIPAEGKDVNEGMGEGMQLCVWHVTVFSAEGAWGEGSILSHARCA